MLLVLTGSADATADYLVQRLRSEGHRIVRLDTDRVPGSIRLAVTLADSELILDGAALAPGDITNVWYRRPQAIRVSDGQPEEAAHAALEWSEALEGWLAQIPVIRWMNHPAFNSLASHKIEQLRRARRLGFNVPDTIVTQSGDSLRAFWKLHGGAVVAKPLASGFIEREHRPDSNIFTSSVRADDLSADRDLALVPTMFQERVAKTADVRVCVVDGDVSAVVLTARDTDGHQRLDIRRDNMRDVSYSSTAVPGGLRELLVAYTKSYRLRFAAIDMAIDESGRWVFFELNPNGQWAWLDIAGGQSIWVMFARAFTAWGDR